MDNTGAVVNRISYDSFGNVTAQTNAGESFRFTYTGRGFDSETGNYYYRARYYDSETGLFISQDPIGFDGGSNNLYSYVGNSPLIYTDPNGEDWYSVLNTTDKVLAGFADVITKPLSPIRLDSTSITSKSATKGDLSNVPIDNINPDIAIALDVQLIKESYIRNEFEFGVPDGSTRAPLSSGFNPWAVTSVSHDDWLDLLPVKDEDSTEDETNLAASASNEEDITDNNNIISDITPTIKWEFDEGYEDVERVDLFISELPQGQGLHPWDTEVEEVTETEPWVSFNNIVYEDLNPNRQLTATWTKDSGTWNINGIGEVAQATDSSSLSLEYLPLASVQSYTANVIGYINTESPDGTRIVSQATDTTTFETINDIGVEYIILDHASDFNPDEYSGTITDFTEDIEVEVDGQNLRFYKAVAEKDISKIFLIKIL